MPMASEAVHTTEGAAIARPRVRPRSGPRPTWPTLALVDAVAATAVVALAATLTGIQVGVGSATATVVLWCLALAVSGAWSASTLRDGERATLRAGVLVGLVCWVAGPLVLPTAGATAEVALTAALVLSAATVRLLKPTASHAARVAVAGDLADLEPLVEELGRDRARRWEVASVVVADDDPTVLGPGLADRFAEFPLWLGVDSAVDAARASGAGTLVLVPGRALDPARLRRACWAAHEAGIDVLVGTGLLDVLPGRVRPLCIGPLGLARVLPATRRRWALEAKHAADRILAGLALVAFGPLMLAIALAVRRDSPGPAIFAQTRTGRDGTTFTMLKFRTMRTDADRLLAELAQHNDCDGVLFKMQQDPRITRVGRLLRKYSLDELPQLINVVRGEMSLVGPRPALPSEVTRYDEDPRHRLVVRPGLTGLWQVSGRSDLSWDQSVRLDLHYVDNWSWALDLQILLRTVGAVLGHRGAY
ncbi:hypothetical protein ASC77_08805 [Nocardioides sp. Root1257]|nr:hypothetical protein ASC77_08805 [Nocardioides sp. Root1257]KRC47996.1 hypothetical protein ASE24_08810 [Nocardioides sp. Root224]